ncbi:MAG: NAD(P)/FAD-dependent oxidoreductase [Candidatus Aenigmarchaeota archaeon]|nr:NAD(P)/FAD-dependent oxidoreductase [Candidatus Aenigmarchaeota archaeon]
MIYDAIVVGAGPSGSKTAELLAASGKDVLLLEEHQNIGNPVQCTGIDSHRILTLSEAPKSIVMNKVRKARFYSQDENYLELESKKAVYVIDRHKLDEEIAKRAKKAGAEILTSTKFLNFNRKTSYLEIKTNKGVFKSKLLVGADGPNSTVAKTANIKLPREYVIGYQETIKHDFSDNIVELWFGSKITPDFFAWVVPENKQWARVGLAAKKNVVHYFKKFVEMRFDQKFEKKDILGGVIRYGLIKDSMADNILLVGDAASQVKPYSGGGIIYGLIGAKFAASACLKCLNKNRFDYNFLKENYDNEWKNKLAPAIKRGMVLHRSLHIIPDWLMSFGITISKPFSPILNNLDMDLLFD